MITDAQIKAAIKRIALLKNAPTGSPKTIELADPGPRGSGRMVIILRAYRAHVGGEWYAKYYARGRRVLRKIGPYKMKETGVGLSVKEAREIFTKDYAPAISRGKEPPRGVLGKRRAEKSAPTLQALCDGYVANLKERGKSSWASIQETLNKVAVDIGKDKPAAEIGPKDITPALAKIFNRGSPVMARDTRKFISAAFSWGKKSAHSYISDKVHMDWGILVNPCAAIPHDTKASVPGTRVLTVDQFVRFWRWCESQDGTRVSAPACRLLMATGQRSTEILALGAPNTRIVATYNPEEKMFDWLNTKNNKPHAIPLPEIANYIMLSIKRDRFGCYFPKFGKPGLHALSCGVTQSIMEFLNANRDIPHFNARDIRRTWKTMAGRAGLSKEIRDRLQNHAKNDVSAVHYDRYDYLPEKTAAMDIWNSYLEQILSSTPGSLRPY